MPCLVHVTRLTYTNIKFKTLVHDVFQQKVHGLLNFVVQKYYTKDRNKYDVMRGKTKYAVLEGDVECPDVVAFSLCDTRPVNFLSMTEEKLV